MAQIQPPASAQPHAAANPAAQTAGVAPVETTIASLPDKIQQLLRQIQVSGTIAQPPEAGTVILNTAVGQLTLLLPQLAQDEKLKLLQLLNQLFQNQRPLTVVVQPGGPPTQAFILLPPLPATTSVQNILDTISFAQTAAAKTAQPLAPGLSLPAIVLPSATTAAPATPLPLPQQLSSALTANLLEGEINLPTTILTQAAQQLAQNPTAELPALAALKADIAALEIAASGSSANAPRIAVPPNVPATPLQTNAPNIPASPPASPIAPSVSTLSDVLVTAPVVSALPSALPAGPAQAPNMPPVAITALLQAGKEVILNVDVVALPSEPVPVPAAANQIIATVVGNGPNGQLILKAADAVLYVKQSVAAPIGANLLVSVDAVKSSLMPLADLQNFPSLQQVLSALAQADPQFAQQFMQSVMPQPNAQLPGVLLFFMNAFKQGDARNWLGDGAVDILSRLGKLELIAKLTQELSQPGALARDSTVGEWRPYPIPIHAEGRLQMLNLYVHSDRNGHGTKGDGRSGAAQVRFLIDMRMSKLGAIQLDGLVQPKKLDMIVRSENSLPAGLPNELRDAYIRTLGALGFNGGLSFQVGRKHWLVIQQDKQKSIMT